MVTITGSSYRRRLLPSASASTATPPQKEYGRAAKTVGSWIDMGNGYRFRRPTSHHAWSYWIEPAQPGSFSAVRTLTGVTYAYVESPAGYTRGNYFSGNWYYKYSYPCSLPSLAGPPDLDSEERAESVTKCLNKIADNKANVGENVALIRQTARLLYSPVKAYTDLLKAFPRGLNRRDLARFSYRELIMGRVPKRIAEQYLAYVYGFKPLMEDVYGISELLKEHGKAPMLMHANAKARRRFMTGAYAYTNISADSNERWDNGAWDSLTRTIVWCKPNPQYQFLRCLNQLGLLNPASLVWELVPYSFVVDWLLPIGPVLTAMSAPAGLDFVAGSTSRRLRGVWECSSDMRFPGGYRITKSEPATGRLRYEGYRRTSLSNWPQPGLYVDRDPLGLSRDGSDRLFKALALTVAQMPNLR